MTPITSSKGLVLQGFGRRSVLQLAAVVAIAVVGISFGRWVIPASTSSAATNPEITAQSTSAAAIITQRSFDSGRLDSILFPESAAVADTSASVVDTNAPRTMSAAAIITQRSYDSGRLDNILFPDDVAVAATKAPNTMSAAETIAMHKYESGKLDEILFGAN
jgi:hypothetical protein